MRRWKETKATPPHAKMTEIVANDIARQHVEAGENFVVVLDQTIPLRKDQSPGEWAAVFRIALAHVILQSHGQRLPMKSRARARP